VVGRHGAGAPVATEHRRLLSSACSHWHMQPVGTPSLASKTMFQHCSGVVLGFKWCKYKDRTRRCRQQEDPAVGCHEAGAPVALLHGHGSQAAPVVRLLTLAHAAQWRTITNTQNHISTLDLREMVKIQRQGTTLRATRRPCSGTPWGRIYYKGKIIYILQGENKIYM